MKPILEVRNVGKKYRIQHLAGGYLSLRERMVNAFRFNRNKAEDFWALKDVSFDVKPGESIGIIGRNGAGKSTLLKILSKITPPTTGRIISRGRIASLLEVGTGFHQELTGRENIFFNGSLLGMKRKEIERKFDEIVDFSGVEKFLDTPLKHFSSGMQLRLAFSVAAHLDPEILIIDEVLAVGDSLFQAKCVQKMSEISTAGKTVIFVSHNFSSLRALCKKGILLRSGINDFNGTIEEAIEVYSSDQLLRGSFISLDNLHRTLGHQELIFQSIQFENDLIKYGDKIKFWITLKSINKRIYNELDFGINFFNKDNICLIHVSNRFIGREFIHKDDSVVYLFEIENPLRPGVYQITLFLRTENIIQDFLIQLIQVEISDGNPYGYFDTRSVQGEFLPQFSISTQ